ncbi:flagellar hook protein FlgE, partial [Campylobacter sp. RM10541]|nr:flagellar hook protein FlgE [Campylobacter sp. RM10541]
MHIPAAKSTEVAIKANLNSGLNIGTASRPLYSLDSIHGYNKKTGETKDENDTGTTQFYTTSKNAIDVTEKGVDCASLFNASGTGLNLREGQGIWVSYADAKFTTEKGTVFDPNKKETQNDVVFWGSEDHPVDLDITLNGVHIQNSNIKSIDEAVNYINTYTVAQDSRPGTGVKAVKTADGSGIEFVNDNSNGTTDNMKNINLVVNAGNEAGEHQTLTWDNQNEKFTVQLTQAGNDSDWFSDDLQQGGVNNHVEIITAHKYIYSSSQQNIPPMYNPDGGAQYKPNAQNTKPSDPASANYFDAIQGGLRNTDARVFHTTEDLRELLQRDARYGVDYDGDGKKGYDADDINQDVKVTVNDSGAFSITNANESSNIPANAGTADGKAVSVSAKNMNFNITSYTDSQGKVSTNDAFTKIFKGLDGVFPAGNQVKQSELLKLS